MSRVHLALSGADLPAAGSDVPRNTIIKGDCVAALEKLPEHSVDVIFADPPYNIWKTFNGHSFSQLSLEDYEHWLESWLAKLIRVLKPTASIYICGDWRSSTAIHRVVDRLAQQLVPVHHNGVGRDDDRPRLGLRRCNASFCFRQAQHVGVRRLRGQPAFIDIGNNDLKVPTA